MKKIKSYKSIDNDQLESLSDQELLSLLNSAPFVTPILPKEVKRRIQQRLKHAINNGDTQKRGFVSNDSKNSQSESKKYKTKK